MRKWLTAVVTVAFLTAGGAAMADMITGVITEIDVENQEIVLDDSQRYVLSGARVEGIQLGDTVEVEYTEDDDGLMATKIVKM